MSGAVFLHDSSTGGKHSRSTAHLDINKVSLTNRGGPAESPIVKRAEVPGPVGAARHSASGNTQKQTADIIDKRSLRSKQASGNAEGSVVRSGTSSLADTSGLNFSNNKNNNNNKRALAPEEVSCSPLPPNSANDSILDLSARCPDSKRGEVGVAGS